MKGFTYVLIALGLGLFFYAVIGRFTGPATLGFFKLVPTMRASAVVGVANTILVIAILLKVYEKK